VTTLFSEEQQNLLMNIGAVLLICQAVEPLLDSFCELASASVVTLNLLEGLDAETRRKTVGQMLNKLRNAVRVDPQIESMLKSFLDHRNEFVHRFANDVRNLDTPQGRQEMTAFLSKFFDELDWILHAIPGLLLAWSRRVGMEDVFNRTFRKLPKDYIDMIDRFEFLTRSE